jgi:probable F420-dependent oxidoreductase
VKYALYGLHRGSSVDPQRLRARAVRAEEVGFEGLLVGDHIALPSDSPDPATEPRLEAVCALMFLAASTTTIGLGAGVLVLPQRQPVLLAKQLASLDVLSGGRLSVGVGVGYVEAELAAFGVSLADRAAMTDEFLDVLAGLWTGGPASFEGRWVRFSDLAQAPAPAQRPRPPIVVGGDVRATYARAARIGDGWFGWDLDVDQTVRAIAALEAARDEVGGGRGRLEVTIALAPEWPVTPDLAAAYAEAGVDRLVLRPADFTGSEIDELIERTAEELIGAEPR